MPGLSPCPEAEWERANGSKREVHVCVCVGRAGGRAQKEVEEKVCEESGVNEPAKDEVGLAASFLPPSQCFTTEKQCPGLFSHGRTHLPEEARRCVGCEVWVLLL